MKKKKTAAIALGAVGAMAVLALGGRFTADTVQAAGEIAALTDSTVPLNALPGSCRVRKIEISLGGTL